MSQCLSVKDYLAGKRLCGFSRGILGHPVYTREKRKKIISDKALNQVLALFARQPLMPSDSDFTPGDSSVVHCQHCGHL